MTSKFPLAVALILASAIVFLTGCSATPMTESGRPNVYSRDQAMRTGQVIQGTVVQVRDVQLAAGTTTKALGGTGGAIAGLLLTKGKSGQTTAAGTLIGALAGTMIAATAGNAVADEVVVRLENREIRVIVQMKGGKPLQPGQNVLVLVNGQEARIVAREL